MPVQVGGDAGPVDVHVDGDCRGGRDRGQPALELHDLVDAESQPAELAWDGDGEVTGVAQFLEVLLEEAVLTVVDRGALVEASEHVVSEHVLERGPRDCSCGHGASSNERGLSHRTVRMNTGCVCRRSVSRNGSHEAQRVEAAGHGRQPVPLGQAARHEAQLAR